MLKEVNQCVQGIKGVIYLRRKEVCEHLPFPLPQLQILPHRAHPRSHHLIPSVPTPSPAVSHLQHSLPSSLSAPLTVTHFLQFQFEPRTH